MLIELNNMNKAELISSIVDSTGLTKKDATKAVESIFDSIMNSLKKGEEAVFVGFGTFKLVKRMAREGRNPRTGAVIKIPSMQVPKFKPGKLFKDAVNG